MALEVGEGHSNARVQQPPEKLGKRRMLPQRGEKSLAHWPKIFAVFFALGMRLTTVDKKLELEM